MKTSLLSPMAARRPVGSASRKRWVICALLFFAITINYIDRLVFAILSPELKRIFQWSNADYADIAFWFEVAYAIGLLAAGRVLDRIGTRIGLAASLLGWSIASASHAMMSTITGFSVARFFLGLFEAGGFPAAVKVTAEWFPPKERALVAGVFTAGANIGAIVAPIAVPFLLVHFGWQWVFVATAAAGSVWLIFWLRSYRLPADHPGVSPQELAHIGSDAMESPVEPIPWLNLFGFRQTWAFIVAKFFTDAVWRWYLYLLPLFFSQKFDLDIKNFGLPFLTIYGMADLGSIGGGWLSSRLVARGWSVNAARKSVMLLCSLCVLPVMFATQVSNISIAVLLVGLAAAAHQGFSCNIFTTVSDMFPQKAIASVVGAGGAAGAFGAMVLLALTSWTFRTQTLQGSGIDAFTVLFIIAGLAYLMAMVGLQLLAPRLEPVRH